MDIFNDAIRFWKLLIVPETFNILKDDTQLKCRGKRI